MEKEPLFRHLFDTYYRRLYTFAYLRVKSRDDAADITNDVFCRLWERFDGFDFTKPVLPLLYTMTRNRCADHLRSKVVEPDASETAAWQKPFEDTMTEVLEREERIAGMMEALRQLPPSTRNVVELCFLKNKKYREAAEELGISINTVKTLLGRAMKFLRGNLRPQSRNGIGLGTDTNQNDLATK